MTMSVRLPSLEKKGGTDLVVKPAGMIEIVKVLGECLTSPEAEVADFKIAPD